MPIVNIDLAWLNRLLAKELSPGTIRESLEQLGCDVEDVVEIGHSRCPQCASLVENPIGQNEVKVCGFCGFESEQSFPVAGSHQVMRLDLLAARPDLFDVGGIARALRGTLGLQTGLPDYSTKTSGIKLFVDKSVKEQGSYRPYITCAVMTMPPVDEISVIAIMKLQENLHWGVGRDRKLASIGVYDLATITGDITYSTLDPDAEPFVPLGMPGRRMSGRQILESHPKGVAYAELLSDHKRYPVLRDSKGQVLSMPPIINSDETRLRLGTTRIFVDVTGLSEVAVTKSLDTLLCSLVEIGGSVETVEIEEENSIKRSAPSLKPRSKEIDIAEAKRWLGLPLDEKSLVESLRRMRFDIEPVREGGASGRFTVSYPPYRTDIRHMVDVFEDVAIGYGYQNIEPRLVRSMTVGAPRAEEVLSERVRQVLIGLGYSETMNLPLSTEEHQFTRLRLSAPERYPLVANPKLKTYNVVRASLMGGIFEALRENRRRPMPQRLFEIDNTVSLQEDAETGASETRSVVLGEVGSETGYAVIRSVLDALFRELGWNVEFSAIEHPTFVPGRTAKIVLDGRTIGTVGEAHPEVLTTFGLIHPVALAELTLSRVF